MPRAIWKGGISFGLVFVPIKLYSGVSSSGIDLKMLRKGDKCPIKYVRVCEEDGREVPWSDIVKGSKIDDHYVVLKEEDFATARRVKSESIDIEEFVKAEDINPRYFEKPYLLEPDRGAGKTYNLLRQAIYRSKMAGLARFVMRNREHLALLMADEKVLYLVQMRFYDDLRSPDQLKIPSAEPAKKEIEMAVELIEGMSAEFKPEKYKDTYEERLEEVIAAKKEKRPVQKTEEESEETAVEDLMEQLKKSLEMTSE